jgi:PKD repeat protein
MLLFQSVSHKFVLMRNALIQLFFLTLGALTFSAQAQQPKIIPVVVHVVHNYGSENISNAQVHSAIDSLNLDFSAGNYNINEIASAFRDIAADAEIEFRLAQIDPNGNCTDGITRTVSPLTYDATNAVKQLISWPRGKYLNIWVVRSLENNGPAAGPAHTAFLPGEAPNSSYDGILINHYRLGTTGTSSYSPILTHATGTFLNLLPTWGTDFGQCGTDDGVADTPQTEGEFGCDTTQVTCGNLDNVQNFMDYSNCGALMFTEGQKARMHTTLASSVAGRDSLCTPENLIATGTNDGYTDVCVPNVEFTSDLRTVCEGEEVQFTDLSWNTQITQWEWTFDGGNPATSTDPNPVVTYDTQGTYNVTLEVNGSAGYTASGYITVVPYGTGAIATIVEGMEESTFPINSNPQLNWRITQSADPTWERTTDAAATGNSSLKVDMTTVTNGGTAELISPPLNFSWISQNNPIMTFKVAHAPRTGNSDESLRVFISSDCGESWSTRYLRNGLNLSTNGGNNVSGAFAPTATEWRTDTVTLGSSILGEPHVLIKFVATSDNQNNLYLDDINIAQAALGINDVSVTIDAVIYPNPATATSFLQINSDHAKSVSIELIDETGRILDSNVESLTEGTNQLEITRLHTLESGAYFVRITSETFQKTLKLLKYN